MSVSLISSSIKNKYCVKYLFQYIYKKTRWKVLFWKFEFYEREISFPLKKKKKLIVLWVLVLDFTK